MVSTVMAEATEQISRAGHAAMEGRNIRVVIHVLEHFFACRPGAKESGS